MFNKLRLNAKLIGAFSIIAFVVLIVGLLGYNSLTKLDYYIVDIGENHFISVEQIMIINQSKTSIEKAEKALLVSGANSDFYQQQVNEIKSSISEVNNAFKVYEKLSLSPEERAKWNDFLTKWSVWEKRHNDFMKNYNQYAETKNSNYLEIIKNDEFNNNAVDSKKVEDALLSLRDYYSVAASNEVKLGKQVSQTSVWTSFLAMIFGSILSIAFGVWLSNLISKPILKTVDNLNDSTYQVSSASLQLTASAQQLAESNSELASSIEETSSTLEEFTSMINQNNENTGQAAHLSTKAKAIAKKGQDEMQDLLVVISQMKKSNDQMSKIIKTIDSITFQINILSLNAAVEAARAGEAGLGFAVVADEVRNLAQSSALAAKEISTIIEENIELSQKGAEGTQRIAVSLTEISDQSIKTNELIDEIATASKEQTQGISSINKAITQMEKVTQSNASNAEESAASSEELSGQANLLNQLAKELLNLVYGNSAPDEKIEKNSSTNKADTILKKHSAEKSSNTIKKTLIVNPEDIIPLEDDDGGFK